MVMQRTKILPAKINVSLLTLTFLARRRHPALICTLLKLFLDVRAALGLRARTIALYIWQHRRCLTLAQSCQLLKLLKLG